jgi:hypothetical protein
MPNSMAVSIGSKFANFFNNFMFAYDYKHIHQSDEETTTPPPPTEPAPKFKTITRKRIFIQRRRKIKRTISKPVLIIRRRLVKERQTFERIVPKIIETREVIDKPEIKYSIQEGPKEPMEDPNARYNLDAEVCVDDYEGESGIPPPPNNNDMPPPYMPPPHRGPLFMPHRQRQPLPVMEPQMPEMPVMPNSPPNVGMEDGPVQVQSRSMIVSLVLLRVIILLD